MHPEFICPKKTLSGDKRPMTTNPFTQCPVLWAALMIEARSDADVERAAMALDELRRLAGDELTDDFLKGYDDGTKV